MRAEPKVTKYQESETIELKSTNPIYCFLLIENAELLTRF